MATSTTTDQSEAEAAVERLGNYARYLAERRALTSALHEAYAEFTPDVDEAIVLHAADIRLLLAERMALREVLMPFAHRGENPNAVLHDDDFRRARSALQGNGGG